MFHCPCFYFSLFVCVSLSHIVVLAPRSVSDTHTKYEVSVIDSGTCSTQAPVGFGGRVARLDSWWAARLAVSTLDELCLRFCLTVHPSPPGVHFCKKLVLNDVKAWPRVDDLYEENGDVSTFVYSFIVHTRISHS